MRSVSVGWQFEVVIIAVLTITGAGIVAVIAGGAPAGGDPQAASDTGRLVIEGDGLTLAAETGQVIEGTTARPSGTTLTVVLRSTTDHGFIVARETTVGSDGGFTTTFDLRGIDPPKAATLSVYAGDERVIGPVNATVVVGTPASDADPIAVSSRPSRWNGWLSGSLPWSAPRLPPSSRLAGSRRSIATTAATKVLPRL